jgi:hypothetical protein
MQRRSPAKAVLDKSGPQPVTDGLIAVNARFNQPDTYVLRATANDGGLSTTTDLRIVVNEAGRR